jgi:Asp/Glu/hydantoin racemase
MTRLLLINPNTSRAATETMAAIARTALPEGASLATFTAPFGAPLITSEALLATAKDAVLTLVPELRAAPCEGVIVAAFADPGLAELRAALVSPVTGIAEAGMMEAAEGERAFAVVSPIPELQKLIADYAAGLGLGRFYLGSVLTLGDPCALVADDQRLVEALAVACDKAVRDLGAEAIVIGGGPLAVAARALQGSIAVPLVEPVPAAVRLALRRASHG